MPGDATIVAVLDQDVFFAFLDAVATDVAPATHLDVELQEVDTERVQILTYQLSWSSLKNNNFFLMGRWISSQNSETHLTFWSSSHYEEIINCYNGAT